MQTLKEAFAAKLPGEIEKIKRLRKLVHFLLYIHSLKSVALEC